MRRFKRTVEKTGLLTELRAREFYEKPTSERKRKKAAAVKRHFKRLRGQQLPPRHVLSRVSHRNSDVRAGGRDFPAASAFWPALLLHLRSHDARRNASPKT